MLNGILTGIAVVVILFYLTIGIRASQAGFVERKELQSDKLIRRLSFKEQCFLALFHPISITLLWLPLVFLGSLIGFLGLNKEEEL